MKQTNLLTEGAMMAALFAVFLGITLYVPLLSLVSVWLLPLPLIVFAVRNGLKPTMLLWAVAFAIAFLIGGPNGLILAFVYAGGGIVMGMLFHQRRSAFTVLLGGSLAFTAGILVIFIGSILFFNFNLITYSIHVSDTILKQLQQVSHSLGESDKKSIELFKNQMDSLQYMAPFVFVMIGTGYALVTQLIASPVLRRLGLHQYVQPWVPFRDWRFPRSILWYYLLFLIIGFFQHFTTGSMWYIGYYNLFSALQLVILIQGFSFIFFYCHSKAKHKAVPILIVVATVCFGAILAPFVQLVGIMDLGFDFRNRLHSK